jgi:hypothetical protein
MEKFYEQGSRVGFAFFLMGEEKTQKKQTT